jgi:hypothetical protein
MKPAEHRNGNDLAQGGHPTMFSIPVSPAEPPPFELEQAVPSIAITNRVTNDAVIDAARRIRGQRKFVRHFRQSAWRDDKGTLGDWPSL